MGSPETTSLRRVENTRVVDDFAADDGQDGRHVPDVGITDDVGIEHVCA